MIGVRRALLVTFAERYVTLGTNFVTLSVLSRLLTPAEIGVSILGLAGITLAQAARHFTEPIYLIQHKDLRAGHVSSFVTIQIAVAILIFAAIVSLAPYIARAYGTPELVSYLHVVSLCILAQAVSEPIAALMRRDMLFARLAAINMLGVTANSVTSIVLALLGFSFMSIAWATLGSALLVSLLSLAWWRDPTIFRPALSEWREVASFGGYNGANMFLYRISEALPTLILGRILSVDAVAMFGRSISICQLPDKVIMGGASTVMLPAFSSGVRSGTDLRQAYLRAVEYIAAFQWPAFIVLAILAYPIVRIVLGDQWLSIVPLVQVMAIASLFAFSAELNYPVLVAVGAIRDVFLRSLIIWPISAIAVVAASVFGLKALAASWLFVIPFQALVSLLFVRQYIDFEWHDLAKAARKPAVIAACSACGPLAVVLEAGTSQISLQSTVLAVVSSAVGWIMAVCLSDHPLAADLRLVVSALRERAIARQPQ